MKKKMHNKSDRPDFASGFLILPYTIDYAE
jgi:hypothetical protein